MAPPRNTKAPNHWRDRAAQMQALALTMKDPEIVILLRTITTGLLTERLMGESHPHKKGKLR
jgi:hypothetical protein